MYLNVTALFLLRDKGSGNDQMKLRTMISVIDLDPKPVHRIPTWIEKRQDWLKSYLKN